MSIRPETLFEAFERAGVTFFTGVPDSLLKNFCNVIDKKAAPGCHVIAANEGGSVAIAMGRYLASKQIPLVYMQNSGLGNAVNPLVSMADPEVCSVPMVLLVGWRGRPGVKDEPQHLRQGGITAAMLEAMGIPWRELSASTSDLDALVGWSVDSALSRGGPVALLVHEAAFLEDSNPMVGQRYKDSEMTREQAIGTIVDNLPEGGLVVASTGMISRELYEVRDSKGQPHASDFLTVGAMGHASQIALGIAESSPGVEVTCLDGDGSALMHMGGLAVIGVSSVANLFHIVLNNGVHDSVGGQTTAASQVSIAEIARSCGYDSVPPPVKTLGDLTKNLELLSKQKGKRFLEVIVRPGYRGNLGRPKEHPLQNQEAVTSFLRDKNIRFVAS